MKTLQGRWISYFLALILTLLTLTSLGRGTASAGAQGGALPVRAGTTPLCDPNRLMYAATREYRMFYDQGYIAAQRIAAATNEYRWFYDPSYIAAQWIAAAADRYCDSIG